MKITTPKLLARTSYYLTEITLGDVTHEVRTRVHVHGSKTSYYSELINYERKWWQWSEPKLPADIVKLVEAEVKKRHRSINC